MQHADSTENMLQREVQHWANILNGKEPINEEEFLDMFLDVQLLVNQNGSYAGTRLLVAYGGPSIWINTYNCLIEGYWWSTTCFMQYDDKIDLHNTCQELFECI